SRSTSAAAAGKLEREIAPMVAELDALQEPRRSELARWILELDSDQPAANAVLGRERDASGEWLTKEERVWKAGAARQAELLCLAGKLEFESQHDSSRNPVLVKQGGGNLARACGLTLHAYLPPDRLERILRQALRATALSNALLNGTLEVPKELKPRQFVVLDTEESFLAAVEDAREAKGIQPDEYEA